VGSIAPTFARCASADRFVGVGVRAAEQSVAADGQLRGPPLNRSVSRTEPFAWTNEHSPGANLHRTVSCNKN
jgi:hypothetical protein